MAKRILKDPNLSYIANRKFTKNIERVKEDAFVQEGAIVKELVGNEREKKETNWEVELSPSAHRTLMPCSVFKSQH